MLSNSTRKSINIITPTVLAGIVAFLLVRARKSWQFAGISAAVTWLVVYIIVTQVTKAAYTNQPAPVPTGGCDYDATALTTRYYENYDCFACMYDKDILTEFMALGDCQLISCWNYWNQKYFTDKKISLAGAISKGGHMWDVSYNSLAKTLSDRFRSLGLQ